MSPGGIGKVPDSAPPPGLDWDLWQGPRPQRPFNLNILPYKFRWWQRLLLADGQLGRRTTSTRSAGSSARRAPTAVVACGGVYAVDDCRTIPDTAEVIFEHASGCSRSSAPSRPAASRCSHSGEIELRGTKGTLYATMNRVEIVPEVGGRFQDKRPRREPQVLENHDGYKELDEAHARNFLDCVKSRQKPNCDVEEGHRSTTYALLANIALATQSRLAWDAKAECFTNNDDANDAARLRVSQAMDATRRL